MKPILTEYDKEEEGGFYYDVQRKNPLQKISLHANSIPPKDPYANWISWSQAYGEKNNIDGDFKDTTDADGVPWYWNSDTYAVAEACFLEKSNNMSATAKGMGLDPQYGRQSLCNAIMTDDFGITIANNWGSFSAGQSLEDAYNSFRGFEPYLGSAYGVLSRMSRGIKEYQSAMGNSAGENNKSSSNILGTVVDFLKGASANGTNVLRRSLVVQGTRFNYYSGTGIAFSNLGMKFTIFPDYFNGNFKTIEEQLKLIIPYSVGKYVDFIGDKNSVGGFDDSNSYKDQVDKRQPTGSDKSLVNYSGLGKGKIYDENTNQKTELATYVNQFLGWQIPPGGFHATIENIDYIQAGTLMLKLGTHYCLKNLVIQEIQLNYSKHFSKYLDLKSNEIKTCPMYCDVFITFTPANKYSDKKLKEFVLSNTDKEVMNLEKKINDNLK